MSIILMYHRVADLKRDPYGLAVHPDHFAAHVEHLRALGSSVPLEDVLRPGSERRVAITFDDGYVDNATIAAPMLADAGLPATWFITTKRLGRRRFWWDQFAEAMLGAPQSVSSLDIDIAGREVWADLRTPEARVTSLKFIHRHLRRLPPEELETKVNQLLGALAAHEPVDESLTMTVKQLRSMAQLPLQDIGAHTRTHQQLNEQTEQLQRDEILGSVADLSAVLQSPVRTFAYPFGVPDAVGRVAPRLVEESGCLLACTTSPGAVKRRSNAYLLPRLYVQNWDGDQFARRLEEAIDAH